MEEEEHGSARADPFNLPHSVEQPAARTHTLTHSHTATHTHTHSRTHTLARNKAGRRGRRVIKKRTSQRKNSGAALGVFGYCSLSGVCADSCVPRNLTAHVWSFPVEGLSPVSCAHRDPNPTTVYIAALCIRQTGTKCATGISDKLLWEPTLHRLSERKRERE